VWSYNCWRLCCLIIRTLSAGSRWEARGVLRRTGHRGVTGSLPGVCSPSTHFHLPSPRPRVLPPSLPFSLRGWATPSILAHTRLAPVYRPSVPGIMAALHTALRGVLLRTPLSSHAASSAVLRRAHPAPWAIATAERLLHRSPAAGGEYEDT